MFTHFLGCLHRFTMCGFLSLDYIRIQSVAYFCMFSKYCNKKNVTRHKCKKIYNTLYSSILRFCLFRFCDTPYHDLLHISTKSSTFAPDL